MNLHEYQGKEILSSFGVEIQRARYKMACAVRYIKLCLQAGTIKGYYHRRRWPLPLSRATPTAPVFNARHTRHVA